MRDNVILTSFLMGTVVVLIIVVISLSTIFTKRGKRIKELNQELYKCKTEIVSERY